MRLSLSELQSRNMRSSRASDRVTAALLLSIPMCSSRESVRMKNYFRCLMLFTFSGFLLLKGEDAKSIQKTIYTGREYSTLAPFQRYNNYIDSQSTEYSASNKSSTSATEMIPNIYFELDNNSTRARFNRSGFSGYHQTNHVGKTIRRKWRRRRT